MKLKARRLLLHPIFPILTLFGNSLILAGAGALFYLESGVNPHIKSFLDTIWWAVTTVTTVGYGDVSPITPAGKIIGIFLMLIGTALFCSYTALFAEVLISDELDDFNTELRAMENKLSALREVHGAQIPNSAQALDRIENHLRALAERPR